MKDFVHQQGRIWSSPFTHPAKTAKVGLPLAAATALLMKYDQPLVNNYVQKPHGWGQHLSYAGDFTTVLGGTALLYGVGRMTKSDTATEMGANSFRALTHSFVLTQGLKLMTHRQRPDGSTHWSMPSGHAMTSFAIASAVTAHPKSPLWLRIALPAAAGAISVARVGARKHYMSDVAIGGTLGWVLGRAVVR